MTETIMAVSMRAQRRTRCLSGPREQARGNTKNTTGPMKAVLNRGTENRASTPMATIIPPMLSMPNTTFERMSNSLQYARTIIS